MREVLFTLILLATTVFNVLGATRSGFSSSRPADLEGQFPRLGACPHPHICIFPPDVSTFLPGSYFDLRVEFHAYNNETFTPSSNKVLKTMIKKGNGKWYKMNDYFKLHSKKQQPTLEAWNFNWVNSIETQYASILNNSRKPISVNVTSYVWRKLKLTDPGEYEIKVKYGSEQSYSVKYNVVKPKKPKNKAKNVILFISDGTNVGMITAARALARKHTSGKYESLLSFEDFDNLGHVITNSVDSLLTDSSNSASAYASGHKSSVNCLGVYADSSSDPFDDPKVELITELIRRRQPGKAIGIVSTAFGQDATPAAFVSHTRKRYTFKEITDQILNGVHNWTSAVAPDVWLSGGAEYFAGNLTLNKLNYYNMFRKAGYSIVQNKKDLLANKDKSKKLLGVFRKGNLDTWFERNIYVNNTVGNKAAPDLSGNDALGSDQPGLSDMTISALKVLKKRGGRDGFFLMSEAASVDKQLHTFDFPRAWAELIELDVTVKNTIKWLKKNNEYENTLIIVTADHAHAFDVWGSVDQRYIRTHDNVLDMRNSIGIYGRAGWPGYFDNDNDGFPDNWSPKISLAAGTNNGPGHYEAWQTVTTGPRKPTVMDIHGDYEGNKNDPAGKNGAGLIWNSNLPYGSYKGVHSMSDVFIYSNGPSSELFKKTFENWELFFKMAEAMNLMFPTKNE
ncbi:alkaline-phosphatase-like protein [Cokeromyces recurvatus]|uniref:alkaline-phosphatase-like protein n=1 Tax=Cokeromyces recurvatus TaxID=90255 RepID=UPI0022208F69|nr:alkaline-phosphatase-like protein [Cokeromyces recurvatus]KAI7904730.1 alkaline-phosphatase-like protein [Cokeromyces recurvatus]